MTRNLKMALLGMGSVAAVAAPVALAVSCGSESDTSSEFTLESIGDTLDVGMEVNYAPYNFAVTDQVYNTIHANQSSPDANVKALADLEMAMIAPVEGGDYAGGYDVFWANTLGRSLGLPVQIHSYESSAMIPALKDRHEVDMLIAGSSYRDTKEEFIDFTTPYFLPTNVAIYKTETYPTKAEALAAFTTNAKIAVQEGTTWVDIAGNITGDDQVVATKTQDGAELELNKTGAAASNFVITENTRVNVLNALHAADPAHHPEFGVLTTSDIASKTGANGKPMTLDPETDRICMVMPENTSEKLMARVNGIIAGINAQTRAEVLDTAATLTVAASTAPTN